MIIAIDYDGTIADTNQEKVKWIEENLATEISPWNCSRTDCVPIIGLEAYERMADYVYEPESTLRAAEVAGALDALHELSKKAWLYVLTARSLERIQSTRQWLENKEVLSCFKGIRTSQGTSKAAACSAIGADILIDDDVRHLREIGHEDLVRILGGVDI